MIYSDFNKNNKIIEKEDTWRIKHQQKMEDRMRSDVFFKENSESMFQKISGKACHFGIKMKEIK